MSVQPIRNLFSTLLSKLQPEPEWIVTGDDRVEWWPGPHGQRLWIESADTPRLHIETDFLRNVPDTDKTLALVTMLNQRGNFSALVFRDSTIRLHASLSVSEQNAESLVRWALLTAAMQAADADALSPGCAPAFEATADHTPHPLSGIRRIGNDVLNTLITVRHGNTTAPNAAELDFSVMEDPDPRPWVMVLAGVGGLTAELPYTGTDPAFILAAGDNQRLGTALFQATTDFQHPQFGHGVLVRLTLPSPPGTARLANKLNIIETEICAPGIHQLGAWCCHKDSLVFATFVPSVMFDWSFLECSVYDAPRRAVWARDILLGKGRLSRRARTRRDGRSRKANQRRRPSPA